MCREIVNIYLIHKRVGLCSWGCCCAVVWDVSNSWDYRTDMQQTNPSFHLHKGLNVHCIRHILPIEKIPPFAPNCMTLIVLNCMGRSKILTARKYHHSTPPHNDFTKKVNSDFLLLYSGKFSSDTNFHQFRHSSKWQKFNSSKNCARCYSLACVL